MEPSYTFKRSVHSREKFVSRVIIPAIRKQPCPVCLQGVEECKAAVITTCLHAYCLGCIRRWSNLKRNCPLCNSEFRSWYSKINVSSKSFQEERLPPLPEVKSVVPQFGVRTRDRLRWDWFEVRVFVVFNLKRVFQIMIMLCESRVFVTLSSCREYYQYVLKFLLLL